MAKERAKKVRGLRSWERGLSPDVVQGRRDMVDTRVLQFVGSYSVTDPHVLEARLSSVPAAEVRASMERLIDEGKLRVDRHLLLRTGSKEGKGPEGKEAGPDACLCGQPLPVHLIGLGADDCYEHVCSCGRSWVVKGGRYVMQGTAPNPVAAYDRAHRKSRSRSKKRGSGVREQCEDLARRLVREAALDAEGPLASASNPLYTGIGGYRALVTDEEFVRVSASLIQALGPEFYLFQLLRELRACLGGHS